MAAFHFSEFPANVGFHFPPVTAKGTLPTSSLPDSRNSLCISERQLRSSRNFAFAPPNQTTNLVHTGFNSTVVVLRSAYVVVERQWIHHPLPGIPFFGSLPKIHPFPHLFPRLEVCSVFPRHRDLLTRFRIPSKPRLPVNEFKASEPANFNTQPGNQMASDSIKDHGNDGFCVSVK